MESVKIHAPATVANVGCGYDTIGFALDGVYEEIAVSKRKDNQLVIQSIEGADLSLDPEQNVATIAAKALLDHIGINTGFDFQIKKFFKPGSGLGSSASSAAGAVYAVNQLLPNPLKTSELLPFALEGEAFASKSYHADNVAPSLIGGFIVIRSYDPLDYFKLPVAADLKVLIVRPSVEIKTSDAKGIVPKTLDIVTARNQWGNLASLVHAIHNKDWDRLKSSIEDFVAEPVRKSLIPGYDEIRTIAFDHESVGFNISGSGPSMFSLFTSSEDLEKAKEEINKLYKQKGISCDFFTSSMSDVGCQIID
ncbi:homoserine kinase [Ekhidna lutea]|uniref:Homoserine kinase n=1 Tax=Ekhidna lutea TaxID=447679 RepID=A0A239LMN4_EKHLU|nr:homoserine kinase [Ekhidna lutea]SNT31550.1 homoserine kinase [Ekhidna lutea]